MDGLAPLVPSYVVDVQPGRHIGGGAVRIEHRRTGQVHTFTLASPSTHERTRLVPINATNSADLAEAANRLIKAEWNELAVEGELLCQAAKMGYGTPLVDRLMPELLRQHLYHTRMEVSFYTEVQARRDICAQHSHNYNCSTVHI
ncbi:hypothetical protein FIBSPDRAFT_898929 [Athelia psychrophila]|uniref:Uncharacterized protein n=1 Tax=Athelia psychrophila TaxID=1759441 RepID=A0A166ACK0_9AGAM|nr:hypothetical protein FIBSPDRAFT_898929 [Fibularhizoctonia sp. CBS 109695]